MNPINTLAAIEKLAFGLEALNMGNKEDALCEDSVNGKWVRTYNQTEALSATGAHSRKITAICNDLNIDYTRLGKPWKIDINDVSKIRAALGVKTFKRDFKQPLQIYCVGSLKGGSGKTTSTVTLASGIATELTNNYRVGVIDSDPQGTATVMLKPNFSDDDLSVGDLLMDNYVLEGSDTFPDICKESFYQTNTPNLRVLCSRPEDRQHEFYVKKREMEASKSGKTYNSYTKMAEIIDAVKDDFDIILIDTSPYFSAMTLASHYVATSLVVPIKPSENDRDSSEKYLKFLAEMYQLLIGMAHPGYDNFKVLITGVRRTSASQVRIANKIRTACDESSIYSHEFIESDAVTNSAEDYCTVFDYSPSEYTASKISLRSAQQEYTLIINEMERDILKIWGA